MSQAYFENEGNWARMLSEMKSWQGTPYRHLTMTKGRGVDCTLFIGGVWKACGVLNDVTYDYYSKDWHIHTEEELVLESIFRHYQDHCNEELKLERFGSLETSELIRGDLLTFNYPARKIQVSHHASLWIGTIVETRQRDLMINSIEGRGVVELQYGTHWKNRLTNVFRVMEV